MDKEKNIRSGTRRRKLLSDAEPEYLAVVTGLSEFASDEIAYLFGDIVETHKTRDAIKYMLDIAAEKNAREDLDDPVDFSLFYRRRRKKAVPLGAETAAPIKSAAEEEIVRTALSLIEDKDEAEVQAAELIKKFGSALSVYDAVMQNASYIGLKSGIAMRLAMLLYIYLWNGKRGLSINSRAEASRFFGEIYLGGGNDGLTVGYLDEEYRLIEVNTAGSERLINKKRDEAACGLGKALGAKYMIAARRYFDDDRPAYYGFTAKFTELSQLAEKHGMKLLDYIIYKRDSFFALKDGAIADGGKIEFDEFLY